ncbi:hypothetical protein RKD42_007921 [Streptomyces ambofaciens]
MPSAQGGLSFGRSRAALPDPSTPRRAAACPAKGTHAYQPTRTGRPGRRREHPRRASAAHHPDRRLRRADGGHRVGVRSERRADPHGRRVRRLPEHGSVDHQHLHARPGRAAAPARRGRRPTGPQAHARRRAGSLRCRERPRGTGPLGRGHARRPGGRRCRSRDDHAGHPRRYHLHLPRGAARQGDRRVDGGRRRRRHPGHVPLRPPRRRRRLASAVRPPGDPGPRGPGPGPEVGPQLPRGPRPTGSTRPER